MKEYPLYKKRRKEGYLVNRAVNKGCCRKKERGENKGGKRENKK